MTGAPSAVCIGPVNAGEKGRNWRREKCERRILAPRTPAPRLAVLVRNHGPSKQRVEIVPLRLARRDLLAFAEFVPVRIVVPADNDIAVFTFEEPRATGVENFAPGRVDDRQVARSQAAVL